MADGYIGHYFFEKFKSGLADGAHNFFLNNILVVTLGDDQLTELSNSVRCGMLLSEPS